MGLNVVTKNEAKHPDYMDHVSVRVITKDGFDREVGGTTFGGVPKITNIDG